LLTFFAGVYNVEQLFSKSWISLLINTLRGELRVLHIFV